MSPSWGIAYGSFMGGELFGGGIGSAVERNLLDLAKQGQDKAEFDDSQKAVYQRMVEMYETITAHRETFENIPELPEMSAQKLTADMFDPSSQPWHRATPTPIQNALSAPPC